MKQLGLVIIFIIIAAALTASVMAEDGQVKKGPGPKFLKADTNGDGKLSLPEFKTAFPGGDSEKRFEAADTNKDGFISPAELKAAHGKKPVAPAKETGK